MIARFQYLPYGLAAVLIFVGLKMVLADVISIPSYVSLLIIVVALTIAVVASVRQPPRPPDPPAHGADQTGHPARTQVS